MLTITNLHATTILPELVSGRGTASEAGGGGVCAIILSPSVSRWRDCHLPETSSGRI